MIMDSYFTQPVPLRSILVGGSVRTRPVDKVLWSTSVYTGTSVATGGGERARALWRKARQSVLGDSVEGAAMAAILNAAVPEADIRAALDANEFHDYRVAMDIVDVYNRQQRPVQGGAAGSTIPRDAVLVGITLTCAVINSLVAC